LSIDGGGIRGIVPGVVLAELERRAGRAIHEMFELVAGTSTGGILALGLTCPARDGGAGARYSAAEMVDLYVSHGDEIFDRSAWRRIPGAELFEERYSAESLERLLEEYFGQAHLRHALVDVLVAAYEIESRSAFFFKSRRARVDPAYDFAMSDVARATSAAPTYFEPHRIDVDGGYYSLVDGGVFANNPAMCAVAEAFHVAPERERPDVVVASLGTGQLTRSIPHHEATGFGLAKWVRPIIGVMMDGASDAVGFQCDNILGSRHVRFQVRLDEGSDDMDDASDENVRTLHALGERMVQDEDERLDRLLGLLL
jgi:patatin-like phospholipase/acyl hydrolase